MLMVLVALICVGVLGAALFVTGIVLSVLSLVAVGIGLLAVSVVGMIIKYILNQKPVAVHVPIPYTTNNMNTMKRNKSDTDLELINRQTADYEGNIV
jgi:hypothetical protein